MLLSASVPPAIVTHLPVCTFLIWLTPLPVTSLIRQVRDGWLSQSNCRACRLLAGLSPPAMVRHLPVCTFLIWYTPPLISLSIQLRDGWLSQSNWTVSTLLSVLTPPAMVRHLPVLRLISITGLLTGAAWVATPLAQNRPRMNTPDATRPAGARWKMVMMSLQCGPGGREQFSARLPCAM